MAPIPVCLALLCLSACSASATTYFLDASGGDDARAGTSLQTAWRTLARANAALSPGDTCLLRAGTYPDSQVAPARSGTPGAPIVYAAFASERPEITGGTDGCLVNLEQKSYITVRGLRIHSPRGHDWVVRISGEQAQGNRIEQCDVSDPEGYAPIVIAGGASHNTISDCTVHDTGHGEEGSGDAIVITDKAHDNAIVGNACFNACHSQIMVINGASHNLIAGNDLYSTRRDWGGAGINLCLYADDNVISGNRIHDLGYSRGDKCAIQINTRGNVIHGNVIANVGGYGISPQSYAYRGDRQEAVGNLISHNTVYGCGRQGLMIYDAGDCVSRQNRFTGNIVVGSLRDWYGQPVWLMISASRELPTPRRTEEWSGNAFVGNVFWHDEPGLGNAVVFAGREKTVAAWSVTELESAFPEVFTGNRVVDPQLLDPEHGDFHLRPGSPAEGRGAQPAVRPASPVEP